jgi:uncharacterized protein YyaL (SSP411 family)
VLADWNGLAIGSLALASQVFARPEWLEAARQAFAFIATRMMAEDGRLCHSWCDGRVHPGTLDDYAAMCRAALALYQATGEASYLAKAEAWVAVLDEHFLDGERDGYFFTAGDAPDVIVRIRNASDNATPSGKSSPMTSGNGAPNTATELVKTRRGPWPAARTASRSTRVPSS